MAKRAGIEVCGACRHPLSEPRPECLAHEHDQARARAAATLGHLEEDLAIEIEEAEAKAWESLARYKFVMFGYWCGVWVHLNRVSRTRKPNPWTELVKIAQAKVAR